VKATDDAQRGISAREIEAFRPRFRPDPTFLRRLALINAAVPITLLAIDAARHDLGANGVNYAIHTTGIVSLICFTLSLAITPLRRVTGWSALVAMRRALGLFGFGYLVIHFFIFFLFDREGSVSSLLTEIVSRRYLFIGTVALLLFLPLAVTSTDGMISRLGPRRWKRLHRLTYVATSLGALHYILLVKSDLRQPVAFAVVIGLLLASRALLRKKKKPRATWAGELVVARVSEETHDVRTFRLTAPGGGPLPFEHQPGQYLNIALDIEGKRVNRSYTISSPATERDYVEITVKRAPDGYASRHLHEAIKEGSVLRVSAPAGRFVFDGTTGQHVLLLAGGVGITPLMAIVRTLTARAYTGRIDLVYSVKTAADLVFGAELTTLAARFPNLRVHPTLTREGPKRQIDAALLQAIVPDLRQIPIYLCGPDPMMAAVRSTLRELGATQVMTEAFVSPRGAPAAGEDEDVGAVADGPRTVQFASTGETAELTDEQTVLEAAEDAGVDIPSDCRTGICGQCKTPLLRGRVVMENQDALTENDRKRRLILACQARPVGAVVVDA
jgi:ferredoxin-NADP reductase/DMSO/TMAO reductase YedYZ heme-binding membrane subunit